MWPRPNRRLARALRPEEFTQVQMVSERVTLTVLPNREDEKPKARCQRPSRTLRRSLRFAAARPCSRCWQAWAFSRSK